MAENKDVVVEEKPKKVMCKVQAQFVARDADRAKVKLLYRGEAVSFEEAIKALEDFDGNPYPQNINALVNVKVQKGEKVLERALAPHKARAVLQNVDMEVFNALFKGI